MVLGKIQRKELKVETENRKAIFFKKMKIIYVDKTL